MLYHLNYVHLVLNVKLISPDARHTLISGIIVEVIILLVDSAVDVSNSLVLFFYKAVIDKLLKIFLPRTPTSV